MSVIDGAQAPDVAIARERDRAQRRLVELAAAVREHESKLRSRPLAVRPQDDYLYRRLRQICGGR